MIRQGMAKFVILDLKDQHRTALYLTDNSKHTE
jgi:hypothetical protein